MRFFFMLIQLAKMLNIPTDYPVYTYRLAGSYTWACQINFYFLQFCSKIFLGVRMIPLEYFVIYLHEWANGLYSLTNDQSTFLFRHWLNATVYIRRT